MLIANIVSDERTYDFEHWDLDKDGVITGYEVILKFHFFEEFKSGFHKNKYSLRARTLRTGVV